MVDVYAHEVVADSLEQECCDYRAVDSAGKCEKNLAVTHLTANKFDLVCHEILHVPVVFCLAGVENE